ncbi:MAG: hypothetical protein ACYCW6_29325 [Candidatus Xenobia bacterium]
MSLHRTAVATLMALLLAGVAWAGPSSSGPSASSHSSGSFHSFGGPSFHGGSSFHGGGSSFHSTPLSQPSYHSFYAPSHSTYSPYNPAFASGGYSYSTPSRAETPHRASVNRMPAFESAPRYVIRNGVLVDRQALTAPAPRYVVRRGVLTSAHTAPNPAPLVQPTPVATVVRTNIPGPSAVVTPNPVAPVTPGAPGTTVVPPAGFGVAPGGTLPGQFNNAFFGITPSAVLGNTPPVNANAPGVFVLGMGFIPAGTAITPLSIGAPGVTSPLPAGFGQNNNLNQLQQSLYGPLGAYGYYSPMCGYGGYGGGFYDTVPSDFNMDNLPPPDNSTTPAYDTTRVTPTVPASSQTYQVDATVLKVNGNNLTVLANGSRMQFTAQNIQLLGGLLPGDPIRVLFVTDGSSNLATEIQRLR